MQVISETWPPGHFGYRFLSVAEGLPWKKYLVVRARKPGCLRRPHFFPGPKKWGKERPESPTLALTFALVARGSAYKLADSNNKRRNKSVREVLIASDWGGILIISFNCVWAHCRSPRNKHQFTLVIIYETLRKLYCLIDIYFSRLRK